MTMAQVLYVLEIADCRSISAAAARLYLSQSALSQQVQRLEAEPWLHALFPHTARPYAHTLGRKILPRGADSGGHMAQLLR